jgi:hypothetical protein
VGIMVYLPWNVKAKNMLLGVEKNL